MALARKTAVFSVAPMIDITDRHFRYLFRLMSKRTTLYTPMLLAHRLVGRSRAQVSDMLRLHPSELLGGGVVAQLGGNHPDAMLKAALMCQAEGYSEVNVNMGCPSRPAKVNSHGASLMLPPHGPVVGLMRTLTQELRIPVSVKTRIGVDAHDSYEFFRDFVLRLHEEGGVMRFIVHSRKALLDGLTTTRQNRVDEIVPLRYDWVYRLKREHPHLHVELNGGVKSYHDVYDHLRAGMDGVMIGRVARDDPWFFAAADAVLYGEKDVWKGRSQLAARMDVLRAYAAYATQEQKEHGVSREVLLIPTNQVFEGLPHAKRAFATSLRHHTHKHTHAHRYTHRRTYHINALYTQRSTRVQTYTHASHIHTHTHTHTHTQTRTHVHAHIRTHFFQEHAKSDALSMVWR
jgi:tRNA-dihydrouridine synthase A